jgi:hypothetical protein
MIEKVREIKFGKAIARVKVTGWMEAVTLDGQATGSQRVNVSKKVEIVANGKVVEYGYHADIIEYNDLSRTLFERAKLDKTKKYSRVSDKAITLGAEAAVEINAAIEEMTAEVEIELQGKSEAQKQLEQEIEEAKAIVEAAEKEGINNLLTAAQLDEWRKRYNDLWNEGGEGYIPPRVSREQYEQAVALLRNHGLR